MPLKMVRKVTARFVDPPQLETTVGDHTYRLRSEADLWPLYYLHILAEVGGLLAIAPVRRWRLTLEGEGFLGTAPLLQVSFLLTVWWYEVNWLVAYPFEGMRGMRCRPFSIWSRLLVCTPSPLEPPSPLKNSQTG
ncbi:MAG: hypothetical protein SXV54_08020 [Chloroflexota bacterium]|nr:hypothetical protein [Chloroflexota bacterium]